MDQRTQTMAGGGMLLVSSIVVLLYALPTFDWIPGLVVGIAALAYQLAVSLRPRWWGRSLGVLLTTAAMGLATLTIYQVDVARRVHNIGLVVFFFAGTPAMLCAGLTLALQRRPWRTRLVGLMSAMMTLCGTATYLMWRLIPLERGVRQRAAFLCLWFAAMGLMWWSARGEAQGAANEQENPSCRSHGTSIHL